MVLGEAVTCAVFWEVTPAVVPALKEIALPSAVGIGTPTVLPQGLSFLWSFLEAPSFFLSVPVFFILNPSACFPF